MDDREIAAVAADIRSRIEPSWAGFRAERDAVAVSLGRTPPFRHPAKGMCRATSAVLADVLTVATGRTWSVDGGETWGGDVGGMKDAAGEWQGHYWVRSGRVIVDVTADQFGHDPVVMTTTDDPRYRANYSRKELARHLRDAAGMRRSWAKAIAGQAGDVHDLPSPSGP